MKKISIIIPIYNAEQYLRKCIDSAVMQTLDDIQILLVNDCSTDSSAKICKEYEEKYDNVELINLEQNSGPQIARNKGLERAQGEYIIFIDADDSIDLKMCEILYNKAQINRPDILMYNVIDNQQGKCEKFFKDGLYDKRGIRKTFFPKMIAYINETGWIYVTRWAIWLRMFNRQFLEDNNIRFDNRFRRCQDLMFTVDSTLAADKIEYFGEGYLYYQIIHSDSLSRGYNKDLFDLLKPLIISLKEMSDHYKEYDFHKQVYLRGLVFIITSIRNERKAINKPWKEIESEINRIVNDPVTQMCIDGVQKVKTVRYQSVIKQIKEKDIVALYDNSADYSYKYIRIYRHLHRMFGYRI